MNKDIIILVADLNMKGCLDGLFQRLHDVLNINPFSYEIFVHPYRDPGCRLDAVPFLRTFQNGYRYALVVFDKEGCGKENLSRIELETELENNLDASGWNDRAKTIVIDPELENWVWVKSPRLAQIINWGDINKLYQWLQNSGFGLDKNNKPPFPKEAFEKALYLSRKRRSSSIYYEIASQVSFKGCTDQSFGKMITCIQTWFSKNNEKQKLWPGNKLK